MTATEHLRIGEEARQMIHLYAALSHSHEGHVRYGDRRYPNTTFRDVAEALRLSSRAVQQAQANLIDEVEQFATLAMSGKAGRSLLNSDGEPLFRLPLFYFLDVDPDDVLRGLYLGGLRDAAEVRSEAESRYHCDIGAGRMLPVFLEALDRLGLDGAELAHGEHFARIDEYRQKGLLGEYGQPGVAPMFVRYRRGRGASDDAAIVAAGMLWGVGVAAGVALADFIDTFEKGFGEYLDRDYEAALRIESEWGGLKMGREEAYRLIMACAKPEGDVKWPDCSARYLVRSDLRLAACALEAHFLHLLGLPAPQMDLDRRRIDNHWFYAQVRERIQGL